MKLKVTDGTGLVLISKPRPKSEGVWACCQVKPKRESEILTKSIKDLLLVLKNAMKTKWFDLRLFRL